jgi:nicotinate dehydrogenase subunit B
MEPVTDSPLTTPVGMARRTFLRTSGPFVIAISVASSAEATETQPTGEVVVPPDAAKLSAWLTVHPDNRITLFTGKVELGNGNATALAQIAAEELDFPIDRLDVVMGTTSMTVDQGPTYGSLTIQDAGPQIRHAAAAARAALLDLAAAHFRTGPEHLLTRDGQVMVKDATHNAISYGNLTAGGTLDVTIGARGRGFALEVAPSVKVKSADSYTVVGRPIRRKDIPAKVAGTFTYIQDVKVDGMLHGRVVRPYGVGARLLSVDADAVKDIPGFVRIVREGNFLGVVAETEWAAIESARRLGSVLKRKGPDAYAAIWSRWDGLPVQDEIWKVVRETAGTDTTVVTRGSVEAALARAQHRLSASYQTPFQMHGSIGPSCAVADVTQDRDIIWSGTQMPHQLRRDMAKLLNSRLGRFEFWLDNAGRYGRDLANLLGLRPEQIEVRWVEAAGAYGRNGLEHAVADAALMSKVVGRPVRVQWMRWDEHGWEPKGPPLVQDLEAAIDERGKVIAWKHHMWVPTFMDTTLIADALIGAPERVGSIGRSVPAVSYAYQFENAEVVSHCEGRVALRTAWLRSPAQFETTFAMESFIDEIAAATAQDPLNFRVAHLRDERAIGVLRAAAETYGWNPRPPRGQRPAGVGPVSGRGIAWVNRGDTRVATIVDIAIDPATGIIRVSRVVVAHDCGLVVNPDAVRNQIEGNVIQSISRTLHEEVEFDRANVTSLDWLRYPILRFDEVPDRIDIVLVNNAPEFPSHGAGEPATCPTAAAISNAVFDATGVRLRQVPFRPDRFKSALQAA